MKLVFRSNKILKLKKKREMKIKNSFLKFFLRAIAKIKQLK